MGKRRLTIGEVERLVLDNRFPVDKKTWFLARCAVGCNRTSVAIDSVHHKKNLSLKPLAKPGADVGDLMVVLAANRQYGFAIKTKDIFQALLQTVAGFENLTINQDCLHLKQALKDPLAYNLTKEEVKVINQFLVEAEKKGVKPQVFSGSHLEGAVLIVKGGDWSLLPRLVFDGKLIAAFVYQKTLDDKRRRLLTKKLLPYIKAPFFVDEGFLYQVLSKEADDQFLETVARLAKDLPIYQVKFEKDGGFEVKGL